MMYLRSFRLVLFRGGGAIKEKVFRTQEEIIYKFEKKKFSPWEKVVNSPGKSM
jgi:hypothetical protein